MAIPTHTGTLNAAEAGTFTIGGDLTVRRLGYGAMQLAGPGVWGPPADRDRAVGVLRRAVELGSTTSTPVTTTARMWSTS
jgi:pyridoxine 4-dehydrogenase